MISAWQVYLFMQAESICIWLILISIAIAFVAGFQAMHIDMNSNGLGKDFSRPRRKLWIAAILFSIAAFIPSRETIAAMYIVPKLTSNEVVEPVTKEAKELYGLFKDALIDLADKGKD